MKFFPIFHERNYKEARSQRMAAQENELTSFETNSERNQIKSDSRSEHTLLGKQTSQAGLK